MLASAAAFAPAAFRPSQSRSLSMADKSSSLPFLPQPANTVGMVGDVGFDPLGFSNWIDVKWLREAELKHGRICMLAVVGFISTYFFHLPGEMHNVGPVEAHDAAVKSGAMGQLLLWLSLFEIITFRGVTQMMQGESDRAPGDFGFDPLGLSSGSQEKKDTLALKELKNGRLAMLAFSGIVTQGVLTGQAWPF